MRSLSLVLLTLVLPLASFADGGDDKGSSSTPVQTTPSYPGGGPCNGTCGGNFSKLENLFNTGVPPTFPTPFLGGFAGRCFERTHDDAMKGAAFLVRSDATRNGPIGCGVDVMSVWNDDVDYYDNLTIRSVTNLGNWYPAAYSYGSLATVFNRDSASFVRMNGNYYIEKIANPSGQYASYYCYYYLTLAQ